MKEDMFDTGLFVLMVFVLVQDHACTGFELKIFTSCEDLKTPGGFNYSYEIREELLIEEWNSSVVLAVREKGTEPECLPEVKNVSCASIVLGECMNVSYRSMDISYQERWIHFIVKDNAVNRTEEESSGLTVGLAICIFILIVILAGVGVGWKKLKKKCTCGPPCDREDVERNAAESGHYTQTQVDGQDQPDKLQPIDQFSPML